MMSFGKKVLGFIPSFTTPAGTCLTASNWEETGVSTGALQLADLLVKPGYALLSLIPRLGSYCGWEKSVVLDASFRRTKNGMYTVRSQYDGSIVKHTVEQLISLIKHLNPEFLLLPEDITNELEDTLPETIIALSSASPTTGQSSQQGVYFTYDKTMSWSNFLALLEDYRSVFRYVAGEFEPTQIAALLTCGVQGIQSDLPAADAFHGRVYTSQGSILLQDEQYELELAPLDEGCKCPTCSQKFTRAYLHHLLAQTPLLCQRMLIQHNVHYCNALV